MKRAKLRELIRDVLDEREAIPERPVTMDTLAVDFVKRTVSFRGYTHTVTSDGFAIPMLNTDRFVFPRDGGTVV